MSKTWAKKCTTCGHSRDAHGYRAPTWCLHGTLPDSDVWTGDCDCSRFTSEDIE